MPLKELETSKILGKDEQNTILETLKSASFLGDAILWMVAKDCTSFLVEIVVQLP